MTYVGMPHIWYGNEVGMTGGKDPDCRRPMDWNYEADNRKVELREYYGRITRYRRDHKVLSLGDFQTVITDGKLYGYARRLDADCAFTLLNAGSQAVTVDLTPEMAAEFMTGSSSFTVITSESGCNLNIDDTVELGKETISIIVPPLSGILLAN
jgi:glycosidase